MRKTRLNYHDRLDQVSYVMKTKQKKQRDRSYRCSVLENDIEWSGPIGLGVVFNKKPDITMK